MRKIEGKNIVNRYENINQKVFEKIMIIVGPIDPEPSLFSNVINILLLKLYFGKEKKMRCQCLVLKLLSNLSRNTIHSPVKMLYSSRIF